MTNQFLAIDLKYEENHTGCPYRAFVKIATKECLWCTLHILKHLINTRLGCCSFHYTLFTSEHSCLSPTMRWELIASLYINDTIICVESNIVYNKRSNHCRQANVAWWPAQQQGPQLHCWMSAICGAALFHLQNRKPAITYVVLVSDFRW